MLDNIVMVIGAALATFSVVVLAYPLLKSRSLGRPEMLVTEEESPEMGAIYESIRTLRLEYDLGRVEETLYRQQLSDYRLLAAAALRRWEEQQSNAALLLEQEVLMARANLVGADGNLAGNPDSCPSCGEALKGNMEECPECAAKLVLEDYDLP